MIAATETKLPRLLMELPGPEGVGPFDFRTAFTFARLPTNKRLLDPSLDPKSGDATALLTRWGHLHAVRTFLSSVAFVIFVWRLTN